MPDKALKNEYRTPPALFAALDAEYNFILDAAATEGNTLCRSYITRQQDALTALWSPGQPGAVWCNPPYDSIALWTEKASQEATGINPVVMLLPADTSTGWFKHCLYSASEIIFITGGRLSFIDPQTGQPANGNPKPSMLVVFRPEILSCLNRLRVKFADRDRLLNRGGEILRWRQNHAGAVAPR